MYFVENIKCLQYTSFKKYSCVNITEKVGGYGVGVCSGARGESPAPRAVVGGLYSGTKNFTMYMNCNIVHN